VGSNLIVICLGFSLLWLANLFLPIPDRSRYTPKSNKAPLPRPLGSVSEVMDGDTVLLADGTLVRLKGIDTPEQGQEGHDEAGQALQRLVLGREIRLEYEEESSDRYGRLLAYVSTRSGLAVNEALVRSGRAWIYRQRPGTAAYARLLKAQRSAMADRSGLWSGFEDRKARYIGSRGSRIFHVARCRHGRKISAGNRESFERLYDAFWQGYSPCRSCMRIRRPLEGF